MLLPINGIWVQFSDQANKTTSMMLYYTIEKEFFHKS